MRQYSLDLRQKVINFVYAGNTQRSISKVFNLSKTTVHAWCLRCKSKGLAVRKSIEVQHQELRKKVLSNTLLQKILRVHWV